MTINWSISLRSIQELSDLPKKERKRLWRKYSTSGFRHWQTWAALAGCILWAIFIGEIRILISGLYPNLNKHLLIVLGSIFGIGLGLYFFNIVLISMVRPYIRAERKR